MSLRWSMPRLNSLMLSGWALSVRIVAGNDFVKTVLYDYYHKGYPVICNFRYKLYKSDVGVYLASFFVCIYRPNQQNAVHIRPSPNR